SRVTCPPSGSLAGRSHRVRPLSRGRREIRVCPAVSPSCSTATTSTRYSWETSGSFRVTQPPRAMLSSSASRIRRWRLPVTARWGKGEHRGLNLRSQVGLDETVEIAVEHGLGVADFEVGAVILHHLVRVEH